MEMYPTSETWNFLHGKSEIDKAKEWKEDLTLIHDINSIGEFWKVINNIQEAQNLLVDNSYYLFKNGKKPIWEEPENIKGGQWRYILPCNSQSREVFHRTCIALLSGKLPSSILGVSYNMKEKMAKISVWTTNSENADEQLAIGHILHQVVWELPIDQNIVYAIHCPPELPANLKVKTTNIVYVYPYAFKK